jgi:hypothetical protein
MTAEHKNIYMALCAAQMNMGRVTKGSVNPAYRSRYADLADVVSVVVPALSDQGIAMYHSMIRDSDGMMMRTTLSHGATDTHIHCDVPLIVDKNNMQGMKSATTYAKRIGLESLTGIAPDTDDDGNAAAAAPPPARQKPAPKPQNPAKEAVDAATGALGNAETLDALKAIWMDLPGDVKAVPAVIQAKDARKAEIETDAAHDAAVKGDDTFDAAFKGTMA